jgi:hypothetical protein
MVLLAFTIYFSVSLISISYGNDIYIWTLVVFVLFFMILYTITRYLEHDSIHLKLLVTSLLCLVSSSFVWLLISLLASFVWLIIPILILLFDWLFLNRFFYLIDSLFVDSLFDCSSSYWFLCLIDYFHIEFFVWLLLSILNFLFDWFTPCWLFCLIDHLTANSSHLVVSLVAANIGHLNFRPWSN